jgi:hypothetical protein
MQYGKSPNNSQHYHISELALASVGAKRVVSKLLVFHQASLFIIITREKEGRRYDYKQKLCVLSAFAPLREVFLEQCATCGKSVFLLFYIYESAILGSGRFYG